MHRFLQPFALSVLLALAASVIAFPARAEFMAYAQATPLGFDSYDIDTGRHLTLGVVGGVNGSTTLQWAETPLDPSQGVVGQLVVDKWFGPGRGGRDYGGLYTDASIDYYAGLQAQAWDGAPVPGPGQHNAAYASVLTSIAPQADDPKSGFRIAPRSRTTVTVFYDLKARIDSFGCWPTQGCEMAEAMIGLAAWGPGSSTQSFFDVQTLRLDWDSAGQTDAERSGRLEFMLLNTSDRWEGVAFAMVARALVVATPVPEPATWALMGGGLLGLGLARRRRTA